MKKYLNEDLFKIIISIVFALISLVINNIFLKLIFLVMSYISISYEMYIEAYNNIKEGEIFDEGKGKCIKKGECDKGEHFFLSIK